MARSGARSLFSNRIDGGGGVRDVIRWYANKTGEKPKVLDFASGYGRTTRFVVEDFPAENLWVSDLQAGAVAFQVGQFGVHGFVSTADPRTLQVAEKFNLIFALSLFSHLPERAFGEWLTKLYSLLTEHGCLVFSTLGERSHPPELDVPPAGAAFVPHSESLVLPADLYGTLWTTRSWVERRIVTADSSARWRCVPRALWHLQDLWIVARGDAPDPSTAAVSIGPEAHLEACRLRDQRCLELSGWAIDHDDRSRPPIVEVQVGEDQCCSVIPSDPRPDVVAALRMDRAASPGWSVVYHGPTRTLRGADIMVVRARGVASEFLVHAAPFDSSVFAYRLRATERALRAGDETVASLIQACERERQRCAQLQERVAWMQQSRFWKARERWFRVKNLFR